MRRKGLAVTGSLTVGIAALFRGCEAAKNAYAANVLPGVRAALRALFSASDMPVCEIALIALAPTLFLLALCKKGRCAAWLCELIALSLALTWLPVCYAGSTEIEPDARETLILCEQSAKRAASLRRGLAQDERGRLLIPYDDPTLRRTAADIAGTNVVPKAARLKTLYKKLGVSGWYSPVTNEAVVDLSLPDAALPFTLLHELMHAKGVSSEALANYEAYRACLRGDPTFRYSGELNALWYCMNALRKADRAAWERVVSDMDEAVLRDFRALNGFAEAKESAWTRVQDALTEIYLRVAGCEGYGGFVAYLAADPLSHGQSSTITATSTSGSEPVFSTPWLCPEPVDMASPAQTSSATPSSSTRPLPEAK